MGRRRPRPGVLSDKRLDSPPFGHFVNELDLRFRPNFNLEASDVDPIGFDRAVLEVSFDGGNTFRTFLTQVASSAKAGTTALSARIAGVPSQAGTLGVVIQRVSLRPYSEFHRFRSSSSFVGAWPAIKAARAKAGVLTQLV